MKEEGGKGREEGRRELLGSISLKIRSQSLRASLLLFFVRWMDVSCSITSIPRTHAPIIHTNQTTVMVPQPVSAPAASATEGASKQSAVDEDLRDRRDDDEEDDGFSVGGMSIGADSSISSGSPSPKKKKSNGKKGRKRRRKGAPSGEGAAGSKEQLELLEAAHKEVAQQQDKDEPENSAEAEFINSYFERDNSENDSGNNKKGLPVFRCKVCVGSKPGKILERKTSGRILVHNSGNLKCHLALHDVRFGDSNQKKAVEKRKEPSGQSRIVEYMKMTQYQKEEVTRAIVVMCAMDNRPFSVVDGRGFKLLLSKASGNRYDVPSRYTIKRKCTAMAQQARESTRNAIQMDVESGASFTMSFDAWRDNQRRNYLALNLHWCSPRTGQLKERCLAVREFPVPHTAEETATLVKRILREFDVPEERCPFAVTDNCSVMEKCVRDFFPQANTMRFHCVAHWLQLVIHGALQKSNTMDGIHRVRNYVKKVVRRDKWWQRLAGHQVAEYPKRPVLKLFLDGGVRWSATYLMCQRVADVELAIIKHLGELLLEQQAATQQAQAQRVGHDQEGDNESDQEGIGDPTAYDLAVVRQMVPLLRPLYDATNVFQADAGKSSISVIIPQIIILLNHLKPGPLQVKPPKYRRGKDGSVEMENEAEIIQERDLKLEVLQLRAELLKEVQARFGSGSALDVKGLTAYYYAATFLDHRKRSLPSIQYANPRTCQSTRLFMIDTAARWAAWEESLQKTRLRKQQEDNQRVGTQAAAVGGIVVDVEEEEECMVMDVTAEEAEYMAHAAIVGGGEMEHGKSGPGDVVRLSLAEHQRLAGLELDRFTSCTTHTPRELSIPPLEWWAKEHTRRQFPYLSGVARRLLSIPASSASAERVFSQAGLTLGDLRQRMGTGTLEDLMVIKYHHSEGNVYVTPREWAELENDDEQGK